MANPYQLLSIQTGTCQPMEIQGRKIMTAIGKTPVSDSIEVTKLGLKGDEQADPSVHGGLSKAVYAYPSEHYGYWEEQVQMHSPERSLPNGSLGENLTISGLLETDVYVGDELHFENCVLRVTQPRNPCYKFNAVMNDKKASKKMAQTGYCGFYLSVVQTGSIKAGERFKVVPGDQTTSIPSLFAVSSLKTRND